MRDLVLVGAGVWGRKLARCFEAEGALGAIVDPGLAAAERAELALLYPNVRWLYSFTETLGDAGLSRVAIATPAASHYELALGALQAGKDVFVEKPLCLRAGEAEQLTELADKSGRVLMVGHLLNYHPCIVRLRELAATGALGELLTITSSRLNLGRFRKEESALWSFAPHDVSVLLSLMAGRLPESVRCVGSAHLNQGVADSTVTMMRWPSGVTAQIHVSWLNPFKEQRLTVVGSKAMAVFDDTKPWGEKLVLYRDYLSWSQDRQPTPRRAAAECVPVNEVEPLRAECSHFLRACAERSRPKTDGAEGTRVLHVLEMAERSLRSGGELVHVEAPKEAAAATPVPAEADSISVHPTAVVEADVEIGAGTRIWRHCHVMRGARIGRACSLGQNVSVAGGAVLGSGVKVQNNVSIYGGVLVEDAVFLGPSCVLTNVKNPRAEINRQGLYERTVIRRGATVGASATIVCGVTLGRYCFIGAGAVVTSDVPDYALMLGSPARQVGYMSRHGHRLTASRDGEYQCPESGFRYREAEPGVLRCLDLDESAPLPEAWRIGTRRYSEFKR